MLMQTTRSCMFSLLSVPWPSLFLCLLSLPFNISQEVHRITRGRYEPRSAVELQGSHVTIILDVLTAVKRMRYQLLKHFGCELPVFDAEAKVLSRGWTDILEKQKPISSRDKKDATRQYVKLVLDIEVHNIEMFARIQSEGVDSWVEIHQIIKMSLKDWH